VLEAGSDALTFAWATPGEGFGTWMFNFGSVAQGSVFDPTDGEQTTSPLKAYMKTAERIDAITMMVPAGSNPTPGTTYTMDLTWTLSDVPGVDDADED
jgi:hypothetical protein